MYGYVEYNNCQRVAQDEANFLKVPIVIYKNACGTWSFVTANQNDILSSESRLVFPIYNLKSYREMNEFQRYWYRRGIADKLTNKQHKFNATGWGVTTNPFDQTTVELGYYFMLERRRAYDEGYSINPYAV